MGDVNFRRPPLAEVSFGLRFSRPPDLNSAHFGLFWAQLRSDFTATADQPTLFDPPSPGKPFIAQPFLPSRVWLIHRNKTLLIQIQGDRFYLNWRRLQPEAEYPRFVTLLPTFSEYVGLWARFLDQQGLGLFEPASYELSYINQLIPQGEWHSIGDSARLLKPLSGTPIYPQTVPVSLSWASSVEVANGRLTASVNTFEHSKEHTKMLQLEIRADSAANGPSTSKLSDWFTAANSDIVTVFTSITTDWAQRRLWDRVDS